MCLAVKEVSTSFSTVGKTCITYACLLGQSTRKLSTLGLPIYGASVRLLYCEVSKLLTIPWIFVGTPVACQVSAWLFCLWVSVQCCIHVAFERGSSTSTRSRERFLLPCSCCHVHKCIACGKWQPTAYVCTRVPMACIQHTLFHTTVRIEEGIICAW